MANEIPAEVMQAALAVHTAIYSGDTESSGADGVAQAIEYAYTAGCQTRQLPPPPAVWDVTKGVDFSFPPVEKLVDGTYRVTTRGPVTGRWHVGQGLHNLDWYAYLIVHHTVGVSPHTLNGATAGEVIAEIFALYHQG